MKTNRPHPHAELLRAIADGGIDAVEAFECVHYTWMPDTPDSTQRNLEKIMRNPGDWTIRRKPRTVRIAGRDVQAGITEAPDIDAEYFVASAMHDEYLFPGAWVDTATENRFLKRGLVHLSQEAARAMGEALAAAAEGGE